MFSWGYYVGKSLSPAYDSDEMLVAKYVHDHGSKDPNDPTQFTYTCTTTRYV